MISRSTERDQHTIVENKPYVPFFIPLETLQRRCKDTLMEYAYEREQLMQRITELSSEIESLRSHMVRQRVRG